MSELNIDESEIKPYAIVKFLNTKTKEMQVDLIPSSWIFNEEGQVFCYYPDDTEYHNIKKWLIELKSYEEYWRSFPITVISYAGNLKQGKRRLKRSYTKQDLESTDNEKITSNDKPTVLSDKLVRQELINVPTMSQKKASNPIKNSSKNTLSSESISVSVLEKVPGATSKSTEALSSELTDLFKNYIDKKFEEMTTSLTKTLQSVKRSILYDIAHKTDELKHAVITVNNDKRTGPVNLEDIRKQGLNKMLPLKTLEDFSNFESQLLENEENKDALISLYQTAIIGEDKISLAIGKMVAQTITKDVELEFSGTGRKINGVGKNDFSSTHTFKCLEAVIMEHPKFSKMSKNLAGQVGKWLSGAKDRSGGRKERYSAKPNS